MSKRGNKPRCFAVGFTQSRDGSGRFCKRHQPNLWRAEVKGFAGLGKTPHDAAKALQETMKRARSSTWFLAPY